MGDPSEPDESNPEEYPEDLEQSDTGEDLSENPKESEVLVPCWRCGKECLESWSRCRWCKAALGKEDSNPTSRSLEQSDFFAQILNGYILILVVTVVSSIADHFLEDINWVLISTTVASIFFTLVTFWLYSKRPPMPSFPVPRGAYKIWIISVPVFFLMVYINIAYHAFLRNLLDVDLKDKHDFDNWQKAWVCLLVVVLPAIFEEILFRYLILDSFRREKGSLGTAIWVSSFMFAMAHIGQPFGLPYLFAMGLVLAFLRVGSGTLILPMIFHAAHNGAVIWLSFPGMQ